ncbi:hypothetical protein EI94DRAFT_1724697 [Lactarius quietus]|nr:hypothetical protein EI94DRAFT_1724697 [Lactarius quietus]
MRAGATTLVPLDKKDEMVANVIWRFLELRGYVFSPLFALHRSRVSWALVAPITH